MDLTEKEKFVLACMVPAGWVAFQPVHIQKLLFLVQEKIVKSKADILFSFMPYDYGPFDSAVYTCLEGLASKGLVTIEGLPFQKNRAYRLTDMGNEYGNIILKEFPEDEQAYIALLSKWVLSLGFAELVGAVYRAFPGMKINSIFKQ